MDKIVEDLSIFLEKHGLMLATAESCTGGMISAAITGRAGSSQVFDRGFVTYSNQSKIDMLGVDKSIIDIHGAVSPECATAMALGALKHSNADIAVSVTGIAGPDGGSPAKPVGLVYIAIADKNGKCETHECHFTGTRTSIREQTVRFALSKLIEFLEN